MPFLSYCAFPLQEPRYILLLLVSFLRFPLLLLILPFLAFSFSPGVLDWSLCTIYTTHHYPRPFTHLDVAWWRFFCRRESYCRQRTGHIGPPSSCLHLNVYFMVRYYYNMFTCSLCDYPCTRASSCMYIVDNVKLWQKYNTNVTVNGQFASIIGNYCVNN